MRMTQASLKSDYEWIPHITLLQSSQKTSILENWGQKIEKKNIFFESHKKS